MNPPFLRQRVKRPANRLVAGLLLIQILSFW